MKEQLAKLNKKTTAILIIAIVVAINFLLTLCPLRVDVTANKRYSLSAASKELVQNIDDLVTVKVFVSAKLPAQFTPTVQQVKDLLWEYQNAASSKVSVQYFDPSADTDAAQKAQSLGIYPVQFSDVSQEKLEVSQGYFGLAILYADQSEVISFVEDTGNLEYQISLAISSLTNKERPTLVFVSGHEEKSIAEDLTAAASGLRQLYTVQESTLGDFNADDELKNSTKVLVIAAPQTEFSDIEKFTVDQFLMEGKAVLALTEGVQVQPGLQATASEHQLAEFFGHYGAAVNTDLILDVSNELASFSDGRSSFFVAYPFWPKVVAQGLNSTSVITNQLENVLFPWASTVAVNTPDGVTATTLAQTTSRAWTQTDSFNLDPTQEFTVPQDTSAKPLAVLLEGTFTSFYKDKDLPEGADADNFKASSDAARLIIVGDADFATDRFVQGQAGCYVFLANAVDYLAADTTLTAIRAKGQTYRPIKELSTSAKQQIKYGNILAAPIGLLVFGFVRVFRKRG